MIKRLDLIQDSLNRARHFANVSIQTFKPHHVIYTATVRMRAKFQIVSIMKVKIKKFEVLHSPTLTSHIYTLFRVCS